jgi:archaellin
LLFFLIVYDISFLTFIVNSNFTDYLNISISIVMRKLFGANKKKKSNNLKTSTLKIPIPMINGVEYADLTESHISTLIGGGNKGYYKKKLATSLSSQRTNNTIPNEKTPSNIPVQHQPVTPSRSISSPPILVMPKPMHSLPPTRYLLENYDYEKTQVESSISSSDEEQEDDEEEEEQIMSSPLPLTTTEKEGNLLRFFFVLLYNCIN